MTERNARRLYIVALIPIALAGTAHALATLFMMWLFTPTVAGVRDAMVHSSLQINKGANTWQAYIGFNLGMGLGVAGFCAMQLVIAVRHFDLVIANRWISWLALGFASVWTAMAIRYWFWLPASACGASTVLLAIAVWTMQRGTEVR